MDKNIEVVFQINQEEDAITITWENHVNEIIDGVESGKRAIFNLYKAFHTY